MRVSRGVKRTFELSQDVIDILDRWSARTGVAKGIAVELGVWVVTHLPSLSREGLMELMRTGFGPIEKRDSTDFLAVSLGEDVSDAMRARWEELLRAPIRDEADTRPGGKRSGANADPLIRDVDQALRRGKRKSG